MANYDAGEITDRERKAAANQNTLARYNAQTTKNQLAQYNQNYDMADQQNRSLADVQRTQNSRGTEVDRFQAQRNLRNSAVGLLGSMGNALASSTTDNFMTMLRDRQDNDNVNYWQQLQENQNSVENSYDESVNSNNLARNEAAINAEFALRGIEADNAAALNNINPNLFVEPGTGDANLGGTGYFDANRVQPNQARLQGYLMPDASREQARKVGTTYKATGGGYFDRLLNGMNGGR